METKERTKMVLVFMVIISCANINNNNNNNKKKDMKCSHDHCHQIENKKNNLVDANMQLKDWQWSQR